MLFWGQVLSSAGDNLYAVAVVWTAVQIGGSGAGWVVGAQYAAMLVFGLLGGAYADRWDRRRVLLYADLARMAVVLAVPVLMWMGAARLWQLGIIAALLGALGSLYDPALQASLGGMARGPHELHAATTLMDSARRLARVVAPGLAGALAAVVPVAHFFTIDAVTFLASTGAVLSLWPHLAGACAARPAGEREPSPLREAFRQARALVRVPAIATALAGVVASNFVWGVCYVVGLPIWVHQAARGSVGAFGGLVAVYGVANLAAMLALGGAELRHKRLMGFGGLVLMGVGWLVVAASPGMVVAAAGLMVASVGGPMQNAAAMSLLQGEVSPEHLGKAYSVYMVTSSAGCVAGTSAGALLFGAVSPAHGLATVGMLALLAGGGAMASAAVRARPGEIAPDARA